MGFRRHRIVFWMVHVGTHVSTIDQEKKDRGTRMKKNIALCKPLKSNMSQAETIYQSLLSKGTEPNVANEFLKGFSGAKAMREKYASEYQQQHVKSDGSTSKPNTVFTQENVNKVLADQQQLQNGGLQNPNANPNTYYGISSTNASPAAPSTPTTTTQTTHQAQTAIVCPDPADPYVFCKKKIPNASTLSGINLTTDSWKKCQQKCWDHGEECQSWAFSKSGKCEFGNFRDQTKFVSDVSWLAGPRHDPNSTGSTSFNEDTEDEVEETDPPETKPPLWKDWRVIAAVVAVSVLSLIMVALLLVASG